MASQLCTTRQNNDQSSILPNTLPVLESKIFSFVPKQESLFPDQASQLSQVPNWKSQTTRKKPDFKP